MSVQRGTLKTKTGQLALMSTSAITSSFMDLVIPTLIVSMLMEVTTASAIMVSFRVEMLVSKLMNVKE